MRHVILLARDAKGRLHVAAEGDSIEALKNKTDDADFTKKFVSWFIVKNPAIAVRGEVKKPVA